MSSWFRRSGNTPEPANAQAAQGKPLLLIGFNDSTSSWEVGQEAVDMLKSIRGPLCSISVCGRARQGKSFLLNQVLSKFTGVDRPKGFVVSPTHQSCTRGIWIWSAPVTITGPDGRKCSAVLMDCEGVDAVDQGQQHSAQIFSLAVLLSSIFIFNQIGAIDAIAIERLAMVCELTKVIKDKSAAAHGSSSNGGLAASAASGQVDFSPAFIWLLRDFQLKLESNGRQISPAEYLEEALLPVKGGEQDLINRNRMRATIKAVFPDRDVATMVRPALTEADLQKLDTLPSSSLRPEFRKDMDELMRLLRHKVRPLAVGGTLVSGLALGGLAAAYVEAVNQGAVPQLVTAWQGVSRAETQKAYDAAAAAYGERFVVSGVTEDHALYELHQAALEAALQAFKGSSMGDPELVAEFEDKLRQQLEGRYVEAKRKLAASGERLATDMLAAESAKLREMMARPDASLDAVESELRRFLDEYDLRVANGPFKYKKAAEFLMNTTIIGIKGIVKDILAAKEAAAQRAAAAEATVAQLRKEVARLGDAESRSATAAEQLLAAQQESARLTGQLAAKTRHISSLESELGQLQQQQGNATAAQQKLQQEVAAARAEASRLQGQLAGAAQLQADQERLRGQLEAAGRREAALQQERSAAQQEATQLAGQLSAAQETVRRLQGEGSVIQNELSEMRGLVGELRQKLQEAEANAATFQVEDSRVQGQLDEERKKVTTQMQEVARLTTDLAQERSAHDTTRQKLAEARAARPSSARSPAAAPAPAATPAGGRSAAGAAGRSSRKRQRAAADEDEEMHDAEDAPPAAEAPTPAAATPAAAAAAAAGVNTDIEPSSMKVAELKTWVTDNSLEDDEFFKLSQASKTKKADWVAYVKKRLAAVQAAA